MSVETKTQIEWRYRETRDSEYAETEIADLSVLAQDCDGDFSYWHVKRSGKYLAAGEISGELSTPYHFDVAMERAAEVARAILKAEKYNDITDCPICGNQTGNDRCRKCQGFGFIYASTGCCLRPQSTGGDA